MSPDTEGGKSIFGRSQHFFRSRPLEVNKNQGMMSIALKTEDVIVKGKATFYCYALRVSCQGYKYLVIKAFRGSIKTFGMIKYICSDGRYNDAYGKIRMYQILRLRLLGRICIYSERTVYRIMKQISLNQRSKHKPHGNTKSNRETMKSDGLLD